MPKATLSPLVMLELSGTCLEKVAPEAIHHILDGARRYEVAAGDGVFPMHDPAQRVGMVLMGTARSFLTAADGRQLTVRYAHRGALIGKHSGLSGDHAPLAVQALTDCTILEFDVERFTATAATEISLANALVLELTRRLEDVYATVGDSAFGSIRQRLIRHLLALASQGEVDAAFVASVSQQQLANAIGSSREVVARVIAQLRAEALVRTGPRHVELLNIDRLAGSLGHWQAESPY